MNIITTLRTIVVAMVLFVFMQGSAATTSAPQVPDFAYPKTAAANAEKQLTQALREGNDNQIMRSLLDLTIAKAIISDDNISEMLSRAAVISTQRRSTVAGALIDLLRARLYADIYQSDSWRYNERPTVSGPLPNDYKLWSGQQFRDRITELCDSVLLNATLLKATPVSAFPNIIDTSAEQKLYYPTLYDFALYSIIDIAESTGNGLSEVDTIKRLYSDLIEAHSDNDAPRLLAIANLYEYLYSSTYLTSDSKADIIKLKSIYIANSHSPYSGCILSVLYEMNKNERAIPSDEMAELLRGFIKKHPSYNGLQCIQAHLNNLLQPSAKAFAPRIVAPGRPFSINLSTTNANRVSVAIYKLDIPKNKLLSNVSIPAGTPKQLISTLSVEFPREAPFTADTVLSCTLSEFGVYGIEVSIPVSENYTASKPQMSMIVVSNLLTGTIQGRNPGIYVVDGATGNPVSDAVINCWKNSRRDTNPQHIGTTDLNGFFLVPEFPTQNWLYLSPEVGKDIYSPTVTISSANSGPAPKDIIRGTIYTDLPLYHQGDTVNWSAVTYASGPFGQTKWSDQMVRIILRNANNQPIDTVETVTDRWGRAAGKFVLPVGQLTGQYTLYLVPIVKNGPDAPNTDRITGSFTVSDYKLPTFDVTITSVARNTPSEGSYTVNGQVRTFSGVSLAHTPIQAIFNATHRTFYNTDQIFADSTKTDVDGRFSIILPYEGVADIARQVWYYNVSVTATSISGETQTTQKTFYPGTSYSILGELPPDVNAENPKKISLEITDPEGKPVVKDVRVTFLSSGIEKFSGVYPSDEVAIPWARIPSGTYKVSVSGVDIEADTLVRDDLIVYRISDKKSPVHRRIWLPKSNVTSQPDNRNFTLYYAVESDDTYVLVFLTNDGTMMEPRWIKAHAGMNALKVTLPEGIDNANLHLTSISDFTSHTAEAILNVTHPDKKFVLEAESFRDKLIPGSVETWTFRTRKGGKPQESAVMLAMYNDAINALTSPSSLRFTPRATIGNYGMGFSWSGQGNAFSAMYGSPSRLANCAIHAPKFDTYGYPLYNRIYVAYGFASPTAALCYDSAPQMMRKNAVAGGVMMESAADEAEAEEDALVEETPLRTEQTFTYPVTTLPDTPEQPFEYRDAFTPLAFFRPMLQTDTDGNLSFTFKVPEANARWYFQAMAFDESLSAAYTMSEIVANKPIMVQPNLPRFLRHGDRAQVQALVVNNSDGDSDITVTTELFDPASGRIVSSSDTLIHLQANAQSTTTLTVEAPVNASILGYRVKASNGNFTDGEQSYLPILASVTPVIDSYPFYIPTDSTVFAMQLPEIPDSAHATLQYCDNPIWYVVTALPGLTESGYKSAPEAASALFSASVAGGLIKKYPQIAEGLREWSQSDGSDSTLVSMLERNSDLKSLLLEATPWVQDAKSDTERMQRLVLLLDPKQIELSTLQAVEMLTKLHTTDKGWCWVSQYREPSMWSTASTLSILGRLRTLGYLPANKQLKAMVDQSLRWYEQKIEEQYRKYPDGAYWEYVELCSLWPDFKQSLTGRKLTARMVQRTVGGWKKLALTLKPQAAMLLKQYGYPRVARQIMESVLEFAESTPQKGMYWPSVNERMGDTMEQLSMAASAMTALSSIMGQSTEAQTQAIAQWLLLQKETRNWGTSLTATEVIARILLTASGWLTDASTPIITIGNHTVTATPTESKLGYLRTDISEMHPSGSSLTIDGCGLHPSWGSVMVQSIQPMLNVTAYGCEAISIEKNIYVSKADQLVSPDTIRVGDRLTVQLTLRVNRDMEYVAITDDRSAAMEPVDQLPGAVWSEGLCFYRESLDSSTRIFIDRLPQGTYLLRYDVWANNAGEYTSGIATVQSQYAPSMTAHSGGSVIKIIR